MDTFATIDFGDSYFQFHLYSDAWKNASEDDKTAALTMATKALNNLNWVTPMTPGDPTVPNDIVEACCDEALELLNGANPEKEMQLIGQFSASFTDARSSMDGKIAQPNIRAGIMSMVAWNKIMPYITVSRVIKMDRVS